MVGRSLYIEGRYQAPGSTQWVDFVHDADHAVGELYSFASGVQFESPSPGPQVELTWTRHWEHAFDELDFPNASWLEIQNAVLTNLTDHTVATMATAQGSP